MAKRWHKGYPPTDGRKYEVRQRLKNAGGQIYTAQGAIAFYSNGQLVRRSQLDGRLVGLVGMNQWRDVPARPLRPADAAATEDE